MGFTLFQVRTVCSVASSQLVKEDVAVAQHSQEPLGLMAQSSLHHCRPVEMTEALASRGF